MEQQQGGDPGAAVAVDASGDGDRGGGGGGVEVSVSEFDFSAERFLEVSDAVSALCGDAAGEPRVDEEEIRRFTSMVTFLTEWKYFRYESKSVTFAHEGGFIGMRETTISGIKMPQFSSAGLSKKEASCGESEGLNCKDFVLHAGGSVWALDWCPRMHRKAGGYVKCEYLAVAAHPPGSFYHKIGIPLTGRGLVQIWCVLNVNKNGDFSTAKVKGKNNRKPKKCPVGIDGNDHSLSKDKLKPRGRPRKYPPEFYQDGVPPQKRARLAMRIKQSAQCTRINETEPLSLIDSSPGNLPSRLSPTLALTNEDSEHRHQNELSKITGSISFNSSSEDVFLSPIIYSPDNKTHEGVAFRPHGDEVLGKFSGDLNGEMIQPHQFRGRQRKHPSKAKSLDVPRVAKKSLAPSSFDPASNARNLVSPIKNLSNGNIYDDSKKGCETESGNSTHTRERSFTQTHHKIKPRKVPLKASSSKDTYDTEVPNFSQLYPVCVELSDMPIKQNANRETRTVNGEVMLGGSRTDGVHQEQEFLGTEVVSSTVKSDIAKSASKRRMRHYARDVAKGKTLPLALPGVCKMVPSMLESTCPSLCAHEEHSGHEVSLKNDKSDSVLHKDIALPRVVLCLAHMGKVAWDIKWRPSQNTDIECGHRMGYLAVLLGNGFLEVWEVPIPSLVKTLYTSSNKESVDPRFLSLKPVFRCSKLFSGGKQSIPLVIEWSSSSHDLLLAGCHDGTVSLWKFSATSSSIDSKPLLFFNADSMPIRSISWAPDEGDLESSNLIVTAVGERLKFWDLRDPYRPLWDYSPIQKHIMSMDWLSEPRWIVLSYDDGFIRILNLCKASSDVPLTGKPPGPSKTGIHSIACSTFAIWSIQVSPVTGHIAYCGVDGHTNHFLLTNVKIDRSSKNRVPQFSCGSLLEKDQCHVVTIPEPNSPLNRRYGSLSAYANPIQSGTDVKVTGCGKAFPKAKKSIGKEGGPNEADALASFVKEQACRSGASTGGAGPREGFPAKSVSMHKVRWNVNRGSEKWLCYGGAAGIVRCYEIP